MRVPGRSLVLAGAIGPALGPALVWAAVGAISTPASAAEVTRVASSFEEDDRFDIHLGLAY